MLITNYTKITQLYIRCFLHFPFDSRLYTQDIVLVIQDLHLLNGEEPPTCDFCKIGMTVKHVLMDCPILNNVRQHFYSENTYLEVFQNGSPENS